MQLVFVEEAFRTLKGDLAIRPVYHQKPDRIESHLFVAFLAYCLSITLRQQLRGLAGGIMPRVVLEKLATIQMLDVRDEVVPESWTGRIVKPKSEQRSLCPRNVVSTVPN